MSDQTPGALKEESTPQMTEEFYLDSETLAGLRQFVSLYPQLEKMIGPIAQYKVIIDANIAISDLLHKHKFPDRKQTAIEELVRSSALKLHAPIWLNTEMVGSTIPKVSKKKNIPESNLQALWVEYKEQIKFDETFSSPDCSDSHKGDPKDVPYVALLELIDADAVLSRDKDIDRLGSKRIEFEFVLSLQSYARAATYTFGIRVGGTMLATLSIGLLTQIVKGLGSLISQIPDWAKVILLLGVIFIAVHPGSRKRVLRFLEGAGDMLADLWPAIEKLIVLDFEKQIEADKALGKTERLLSSEQHAD